MVSLFTLSALVLSTISIIIGWAVILPIQVCAVFLLIGILGWIALIVSLFIYKKAKNEKVKLFQRSIVENREPNVVVIG
ncbi:hypothetical protein ACTPEM_26635, partial [Clostridioides difficile]